MPSEHISSLPFEQPVQEQLQNQVKVCTSCRGPLSYSHVDSDSAVCLICGASAITEVRGFCTDFPVDPSHPLSSGDDDTQHPPTRRISEDHVLEQETPIVSSFSPPQEIYPEPLAAVQPHETHQRAPLSINCDTPAATFTEAAVQHAYDVIHDTTTSRRSESSISHPDPLIDITRLRVRSQGHHCLYPGASFQGTQKSGRNSYDVSVTIVDVDFQTSFLCGYLRIRGLTDDWPELTTYFDAEIIGSRYGFLTQNWGANEQEDMVHWSRFPAFRHVKHELKKPHLTINDRDRGAVFMRWKERFLVPDHRVQDINGASFAGFYYVCVDFSPSSPASSTRSLSQDVSSGLGNDDLSTLMETSTSPLPTSKASSTQPARPDSGVRGRPSLPAYSRSSATPATMSGFYFHQNSEPYQQLSLCHIPERTSSSFEFR